MLNAIPLFHNFNDLQLQSVGAHLALRVFEKGEIILREGERGDAMYVVVSGQVKVFSTDDDDNSREVILKILGAGEFFGELPVFDNEPRSASVSAIERCHLQVLSYRAFQRSIESSPDIAQKVLETLARRLRAADRRIGDLALLGISGRISRVLLELAIMSNGQRVVGEPFTQKDLASMIGASREMVNRTLKDFEDNGYIAIQRQSITLLKDEMPT
ncbi:MAG: Crp/Fnr family transcriptional regulator [Gammaproteobacteria bacterium]|nr:Crp/Fnr family transcriptional regulator [Gammaproteobacteria bacterium]